MPEKHLRFIVEGGKATAAPPIGPALSPLGVNVLQVIERINELTGEFRGMHVPIEVYVDTDTKEFKVEVGTPTVTALIAKEAGIEKGSGAAGRNNVGDLKFDDVVKIAKIKQGDLGSNTLKAAVKTVVGTCVSMGITVDGKPPKQVIKEIDDGLYDAQLATSS